MTQATRTSIILEMKSDQVREFFSLLQQGFAVTGRVGCTLEKLLDDQWGLSPEYVARRVTTIFLDSRAIDDVTTAVVRDGSVVALSGAMPGLVGATMRRGGFYAAMRSGISYQSTSGEMSERIGTIRAKLFNLLLPELGPAFLSRGIIIKPSEAVTFFDERMDSFWQGCYTSYVNGTAVDLFLLQNREFPSTRDVFLTVKFIDQP